MFTQRQVQPSQRLKGEKKIIENTTIKTKYSTKLQNQNKKITKTCLYRLHYIYHKGVEYVDADRLTKSVSLTLILPFGIQTGKESRAAAPAPTSI